MIQTERPACPDGCGGAVAFADIDQDGHRASVVGAPSRLEHGERELTAGVAGVWVRPWARPWARRRGPGGSSGGSAASVATGMATASLGTDTDGSIRIPAALCAVVGLKPTYGLIPTDGATPLSWSLDHAGPIARTVRDVAMVADQLVRQGRTAADSRSGPASLTDSLDLAADDLRGVTVGVPENHFFDRCHPEVERSVREAIGVLRLGAELRPVTVPLPRETLAVAALLVGRPGRRHPPG